MKKYNRILRVIKKKSKSWKKVSKKKITFFIIAFLLIYGVGNFIFELHNVFSQTPLLESKINRFLLNVSNKKYDAAYSDFSHELKKHTSLIEFEDEMHFMKPVYSDYQEWSIITDGINVRFYLSQPTVVYYSGIITYTDGEQGGVTATFIEEDKEWHLHAIKIDTTRKRMEKFQTQEYTKIETN